MFEKKVHNVCLHVSIITGYLELMYRNWIFYSGALVALFYMDLFLHDGK